MKNLCKKIKSKIEDLLDFGIRTNVNFIVTCLIFAIMGGLIGACIGIVIEHTTTHLIRLCSV